jgi:hypothetical protein
MLYFVVDFGAQKFEIEEDFTHKYISFMGRREREKVEENGMKEEKFPVNTNLHHDKNVWVFLGGVKS